MTGWYFGKKLRPCNAGSMSFSLGSKSRVSRRTVGLVRSWTEGRLSITALFLAGADAPSPSFLLLSPQESTRFPTLTKITHRRFAPQTKLSCWLSVAAESYAKYISLFPSLESQMLNYPERESALTRRSIWLWQPEDISWLRFIWTPESSEERLFEDEILFLQQKETSLPSPGLLLLPGKTSCNFFPVKYSL